MNVIIEKEELPYDVTMFWEFYRWEQYKLGNIYLQIFPNGKMYAGQTINLSNRIRKYHSHQGNNEHHLRALKKYEWKNVMTMCISCPWYLLDTIEIFLISYYDLTDTNKGYNKQTGGRKNWTTSLDTRTLMSSSQKDYYKRNPQRAANHSITMSGPNNPNYGKKIPKTPEQIAKVSGSNSHMYGKFGPEHNRYGLTFKKTPEQVSKTSGKNNGNFGKVGALSFHSKPICVFGVLYPSTGDASNALRADYAPNRIDKFVGQWVHIKKHQKYTFYVSKDFYAYATEMKLCDITRELYENWYMLNIQ
jgi:hypothetical protein